MGQFIDAHAGHEVIEERFEPTGHRKNQFGTRRLADNTPSMRHSCGEVDEVVFSGLEHLVSTLDPVPTSKDEERLALLRVCMERCADTGRCMAEQEAERPIGIA